MKFPVWIMLSLFPSVCFASQYLCIADLATGFSYNEISKKWEKSNFSTDGQKFVVAPSKSENYVYEVTKLGNNYSDASCKNDFNEYGFLFCEGFFGEFRINKTNGRYLRTYSSGYYNVLPKTNKMTDESSETPIIEIGKCSPF